MWLILTTKQIWNDSKVAIRGKLVGHELKVGKVVVEKISREHYTDRLCVLLGRSHVRFNCSLKT